LKINPTVTTLCMNPYHNFVEKFIPPSVLKLKIYKFNTKKLLPNTIKELYIKQIKITDNKLLCIPPNVTKLTIQYDQKHLLDLTTCTNCKIMYKY